MAKIKDTIKPIVAYKTSLPISLRVAGKIGFMLIHFIPNGHC
jgi:hypothetical protein